jgi:DNA recombination protein RmuC
MSAMMLIAGLVLGILIGVTIGYLYARGRIATATADLASQASAASERARAAEQRAALIDGQLAERFQSL